VRQDFTERQSELFKFCAGKSTCVPSRSNARVKEALVGVDVSYPGQEGLIEQSCLDCEFSGSKERCKLVGADCERFRPGAFETCGSCEVSKLETPETPRVNEPEFLSAVQCQPCVGVRRNRRVRSCHQQAPRHPEVDNPLCANSLLFQTLAACDRAVRSQFTDYVLAGAMNGENPVSCQCPCLASCRRLEWFRMPAEPGIYNPVAADARIHTPSDRFHLRKFRHLPILEEHYLLWSSGSRMRFASKLTIRQDFLASWT